MLVATPEQRSRIVPSGGGSGLHWDELAEDISLDGLFTGTGDRSREIPLAA